jgi:MerR family transcriptional regulator/heat shock protein HspR
MEATMATVVKRDTRRDTNISLDKPIYTISVASEILETHPRTLMMYEHLGLVVPNRTSTNRRRFSQRDVMKLQTIQKLTRHHSVNLAGVRYILKLLKLLQQHQLPSPVELRYRRFAAGRLSAATRTPETPACATFSHPDRHEIFAPRFAARCHFIDSQGRRFSDCLGVDKAPGPLYNPQ